MVEKAPQSAEEEFAEACRASARAYRELRNRLRMQFQEAQQEAYFLWTRWDNAMGAEEDLLNASRQNLRMVAATSEADSENTSDLTVFEEVTIGEATYYFAEQLEGSIWLSGPIPPDATHINFGRDTYTLSSTERPEWYRIEDIGRADVSDYIIDYNANHLKIRSR